MYYAFYLLVALIVFVIFNGSGFVFLILDGLCFVLVNGYITHNKELPFNSNFSMCVYFTGHYVFCMMSFDCFQAFNETEVQNYRNIKCFNFTRQAFKFIQLYMSRFQLIF